MRRSVVTWGLLISFIEYSIALWFVGVFVAIVRQAMRGQLVLSGLLTHEPGSRMAFHRLQHLAVTLLVAGGYLIRALVKIPEQGLPDVPMIVLAPLMGSQGVYLMGKYMRGGARNGRGG